MNRRHYDLFMLCVVSALYFINQIIKSEIPQGIVGYFVRCYANDVLCGVLIMSYSNLILSYARRPLKPFEKYRHIFAYVFVCGLFWEYGARFIKPSATLDMFDIVAYIVGATIYWSIQQARNIERAG